MLLSVVLAQSVLAVQKPSVGFFFWGYGDNGKPLVPHSIFEKMKGNTTSAPIATHVIAGSGHQVRLHEIWMLRYRFIHARTSRAVLVQCVHVYCQVTTNGTWIIPNTTSYTWLREQINLTHTAGLGFVPLIAGCSLTELRDLVLNSSRVDEFVNDLVEDAVTNG